MVVARADLVEQGGIYFHPQWLATLSLHLERQLEAAAAHLKGQGLLVRKQVVLDDVSGQLAVQGDKLVTGEDAGPVRRRPWGHRDHSWQGHGLSQDRRSQPGAAPASSARPPMPTPGRDGRLCRARP
jgi:hypothetical protein